MISVTIQRESAKVLNIKKTFLQMQTNRLKQCNCNSGIDEQLQCKWKLHELNKINRIQMKFIKYNETITECLCMLWWHLIRLKNK